MAQHMDCTSCKAVLSLRYIEKETRRGLASIFLVRCRDCLLFNIVPTDNVHPGSGKQNLFAVNSDAVAGMMRAGVGYWAFNRFLQTMEIPNMSKGTFQSYQQDMRSSMHEVEAESCEEVTPINQPLGVDNSGTSETILAENIRIGLSVSQDTDSSVLLAITSTTQRLPV